MMLSHARALFLDEISTGLDSAATFDIVCALQRWTRVMHGSATVALLQPSPEVLALFDNLILMRHGQIVFSGSQAELRAHFSRINIQPEEEEAIDFADWLVDFLTDPQAIWKRDMERKIERNRGKSSARKSFREHHLHPHTHGNGFAEEKHKEEEEAPHVGLNSATPNAAAEANGNGHAVQPVIHVSPAQQTQQANGASSGDGTLQPAPSSWAQDSEAAAVVFHLGEEEEGHSDNDEQQEEAAANGNGNEHLAVPHAHGANGHANGNGAAVVVGAASGRKKGLGKVFRAADMPPLSTPALRKAFEESAVHQSVLAEIATRNQALRQKHEEEIRAAAATTAAHGSNAVAAAAAPGAPHSPFTLAQLFSAHSWSVWHHTRVCLHRQSQFYARSPEFIFPRLFQSIFMGLVFGSLFYQLGTSNSDFSPRLGLMLSSLIFAAFANMSEVPVASEFKMVVYKQIDAGMYSTFRSDREREREKKNKT